MKKSTLIALSIVAVAALLVPAGSAMAQSSASASATATATIVAPITLTNTTDLAFGNIVASGAAGTVTVTPAGVRSAGGGATAISGLPVSAAAFNVAGGADRTFTITLPAGPVPINAGANTMNVGTFTSSLGASSTLDGTGAAALAVGGTLSVGANQPAGSYTGTFSVTVAYD